MIYQSEHLCFNTEFVSACVRNGAPDSSDYQELVLYFNQPNTDVSRTEYWKVPTAEAKKVIEFIRRTIPNNSELDPDTIALNVKVSTEDALQYIKDVKTFYELMGMGTEEK